jgi:hypothetical protein
MTNLRCCACLAVATSALAVACSADDSVGGVAHEIKADAGASETILRCVDNGEPTRSAEIKITDNLDLTWRVGEDSGGGAILAAGAGGASGEHGTTADLLSIAFTNEGSVSIRAQRAAGAPPGDYERVSVSIVGRRKLDCADGWLMDLTRFQEVSALTHAAELRERTFANCTVPRPGGGTSFHIVRPALRGVGAFISGALGRYDFQLLARTASRAEDTTTLTGAGWVLELGSDFQPGPARPFTTLRVRESSPAVLTWDAPFPIEENTCTNFERDFVLALIEGRPTP